MKKYILFIPHSPLQFEMAHHWGEVAKTAGFDTICMLLFNKLRYFLQEDHHKCFGQVTTLKDILISESEIPLADKSHLVTRFETKHDECSFARDWSIDRAFQDTNLSYEYVVDLTYQYIKGIEKLFQDFDIKYAVSEKLFLPQRIIHYIINTKNGKHFFPRGNRFFDRFYFEEELDWNWKEALEIYDQDSELHKKAPEEVVEKYHKIVNKSDKGILDQHTKKGHVGKVKFGSFRMVLKKILRKPRSYENIYEEFLNNNSDKSIVESISNKLLQIRNIKAYKKIIDPTYPTGKYVLFLMHLQPEYTVDALAPDFSNQAEFIVRIAKKLPADVSIVVKENPMSVGNLNRSPHYYESINNQPNIKLIDHQLDSHRLVKNSDAVITLTGTVGLEAMFFGKPVIVFGNIFYSSFKYAQKVNSVNEGVIKIKKIFRNKENLNKYTNESLRREALNILTSMYKASYEGKFFNAFHPEAHRSKENIENLKKVFSLKIQSEKESID